MENKITLEELESLINNKKVKEIRELFESTDIIDIAEVCDDIEDISYDFEAEDIGLKEENFAKISSLRQLQPFRFSLKSGGLVWVAFPFRFYHKRSKEIIARVR